MVAVTYGVARVPAAEAAPKTAAKTAPRKSWFGHFMDVLIEARMMQAQREINIHTRWLSSTLDEHGNRVVKIESSDTPLGGW